jgi:hypothetical protein
MAAAAMTAAAVMTGRVKVTGTGTHTYSHRSYTLYIRNTPSSATANVTPQTNTTTIKLATIARERTVALEKARSQDTAARENNTDK